MADLSEVDDIMAELGLSQPQAKTNMSEVDDIMAELGLNGAPTPANPNAPVKRSSGPGAARGGMSSGPGKMSSGPGKMSSGPGAARGMPSSGPGAVQNPVPFGRSKPMASHTPDGRPITFTGPPCGHCGEMIIGVCVNALGKTYHREHFVCTHCNLPFPGGQYIEHEGNPYCDKDYNELFCPRCASCKQPISDKCITALGRKYHPDHFTCAGCGMNLVGKSYKEDDEEVYCNTCKESRKQRIAPATEMCARCKRPIVGEYVTLHGQKMHPEHFRCEECGCEFKGGNCQEFEGKLYCIDDYTKLLRNTCASCHKPIMGRSITALGKVWHPEHFVCFTCHEPFAGSNFYEKEGKPYCEAHFTQNFGDPCAKCGRAVIHNACHFLDKVYHMEHFVCSGCDSPLKKGDITEWESKPMCMKCYKKLPDEVRKRATKKREAEKKISAQREKEEKKASKEGTKNK